MPKLPLLEKKGKTTMPNIEKPECKRRIDDNANEALKNLNKVLEAHPDLEVELKAVRDNLKVITQDNHHHL